MKKARLKPRLYVAPATTTAPPPIQLTEAQMGAPIQGRCLRTLYEAVRSTEITMKNYEDWRRRSPLIATSVRATISGALQVGHEYLLDIHITAGSRKQRDASVSRWLAYCHVMGVNPTLQTFADTHHLRNYVYFLGTIWRSSRKSSSGHGLAHQTVSMSISAIRQWTMERGFLNPLSFDKVTSKVIKGLRRLKPGDGKSPLPLPKHVVSYMVDRLRGNGSHRRHPRAHALADAFSVMFAFLLRVSEIAETPSKSSYLSQGDVSFDTVNHTVTISLRETKSSQFVQVRRSLPHVATGDVYDTMYHRWHQNEAFANHENYSAKRKAEMPFINVDGIPLSRDDIASTVRNILSDNITQHEHPEFPDPKCYCTHSFRKGGATALLAAGVDIATIKYLGRWRSMAWLLYASVSDNSLERAAQALASF